MCFHTGTVVNADVGKAVFFAGPLKHAGYPITRGVRNILVLFLYVEGFHYGPLIQKYVNDIKETKVSETLATSSTVLDNNDETVFRNHLVSRDTVVNLKGNTLGGTANEVSKVDAATTVEDTESAADRPRLLNSGGEERGYVVYRQTVELVNMLESTSLIDE
jgi:hypothetical protein